jgi:hypothetical protein
MVALGWSEAQKSMNIRFVWWPGYRYFAVPVDMATAGQASNVVLEWWRGPIDLVPPSGSVTITNAFGYQTLYYIFRSTVTQTSDGDFTYTLTIK